MNPQTLAATAALAGLVLYTGIRFGLWAPESKDALLGLMGKPGLAEKLALVAAAAALALHILRQILRAT